VAAFSPHVFGIDDGPFEKRQAGPVPVVGVMMECPQLIECVAIHSVPVDAPDPTDRLSDWITGLRCHPSIRAVIVGGISIGGLGLIDVTRFAERVGRAVLVVNRRDPRRSQLGDALRAAGLHDRLPILDQTPPAVRVRDGLFVAWAGCDRADAEAILLASLGKSRLPEPLRAAHLIARALVLGESRGGV